MGQGKVTILDVAKHAGVVPSTVSRVLNGYPDVSEETRTRVLKAIETLGYKPNRAARVFRTGRTQTVSLILPMVGTDFYIRLINAIDGELARYDYDAALFPLLSQRRLERYRDPGALPYHADGLLISSLNPDHLFPGGKIPADLPTVLIDIYHPAYDTVTVDNVKGGYLAGEHLAERPAETFAVMVEERFNTPFASGVFRDRLQGFKQALLDAGQPLPEENVITVEFSWDGGRIAAREILNRCRGPINVFASCDLLARDVMDELRHRDLPIGREVRLMGFDDQPWAEDCNLSTVRQPIEAMGAFAVKLLLKRMKEPDRKLTHKVFEPQLAVRGSTKGGESGG
ncbi:MAG: Extracellular solute-binding protein family 1 [Acetothermia bacterium 64_32]|nr:MAG: Extracellular solute-binding protein family 1 [Acetothermia bacterium 64_32]HAF71506.1 LacI family transcriptional regulator [Candidatus Acetothermia bacterium]